MIIPLTHVHSGEMMYVREDAMSLYSLARRFPTEKDALDHLVRTRWPKGVRCVACNHGKCWPIESTNKTAGPRRLFQCASCKFQFSATAGTLFHHSHLPLMKSFAAMSMMSDAKKGISASQLGRHIGMTYKTAWYVAHRIRVGSVAIGRFYNLCTDGEAL